jgi:membrane associated rhomboid family serine protease
VINLVFTFVAPGISIAGHLGGLTVGALLAVILAYAPRKHRSAIQAAGTAGVVLLLLGMTVVRTALLLAT